MLFMLFLSLLGALSKSTHLLTFLISLELLGLWVFFWLFLSLVLGASNFIFVFIFISILGCESALGLVMFVLMTRVFSKDYLASLSLSKF